LVVIIPDYLTYDSNAVNAEWDADRVAMVNLWGSRAPAMLDDQGASAEVVSATKLAGPPTVGGKPATTLWWDGFTIAKNISDQDAEATFQAMVHAISPSTATDNPDVAVWLIKGYTPGPNAVGVAAAVQAGAKPYPMEPYMGLIHTALGNEIVEFMQGKKVPEKALADAEAAYRAAAREAGFIK
jgi:ABC-type glycerol-3-phosphate transport system substrate-binding protein